MSWGWRKLLQLRVLVRPYIWTKLGNGNRASAWHDTWDPQGPLIRLISPQDISREGFSLTSKVSDLFLNFGVVWPQEWLRKAYNIGMIQTPNLLSELVDSHYWRDVNGNMKLFLVKCAWEAFRPRGDEVKWYHTITKKRTAKSVFEDLERVWFSRQGGHMRVVLFFPSPRFFPLGFSWEGFLRRQSHSYIWLVDIMAWKLARANWDVP
ncbi:hypothetical protein Tco_1571009 [Tanacetum coccineum]